MKKCICALISLLIALVPSAFAELREAAHTDIAGMEAFRFASNGDVLFVQEGTSLRQYSAETLEMTGSTETELDILHIAAGSDGLYANLPGKIVLLNASGAAAEEWPLPEALGEEVSQLYVTDNYFFVMENLAMDQQITNGTDVWMIDRITGEATASESAVGVFAASGAADGGLLLLQFADWRYVLNLWDPYEDELTEAGELHVLPEAILADGNAGAYFLADDGRVSYISFTDGQVREVCRMAVDGSERCAGLEWVGDALVTEDINARRLIAARAASGQETYTVLNLVNLSLYDVELSSAIARFEASHPGVRVQYTDMTDDQLNAALLAQDSKIDILPVTSYSMNAYLQNGVLAELSGNESLMSSLGAWRDFGGMLSAGELYALPLSVSVDAFFVDTAILAECGVDVEAWDSSGMTWPEFYDFCCDVQLEHGVTAYVESSRFPMPVMQYIASFNGDLEQTRFQTEEFYAVARMLRDYKDAGVLQFAAMSFGEDSAIDCSGIAGATVWRWDDDSERIFLLPQMEGAAAYPAILSQLGVNARSENRELAVEFLACYASVDAQHTDMSASMLKDCSLYNEEFLGNAGALLTPESVALWDAASAGLGSQGIVQGVFGIHLGDEMEAFLNGEIDEYQLAESLDEKLNMIRFG